MTETLPKPGGIVPIAPPVTKEPITAGGAVLAIVPANIDQAFRLAQALARSGDMVPKHFQGHPDQIMAAIMRGAEAGLAPMQSLAHIAVINGRSVIWGDALPALMQRAGHHIDVEIEGEDEDACAVATLTRGDTGKVTVRRFSMADAKRAGLSGKQGPWTQYPTRMLSMRARSWAIRDGAADALMGLAIADEVNDYQGPDGARDITPRRGSYTLEPAGPALPDTGPGPEPEPERDEVINGGDAEEIPFPAVYEQIMSRLANAMTPREVDETADLFAEQVEHIRKASASAGENLDAAIASAHARMG